MWSVYDHIYRDQTSCTQQGHGYTRISLIAYLTCLNNLFNYGIISHKLGINKDLNFVDEILRMTPLMSIQKIEKIN